MSRLVLKNHRGIFQIWGWGGGGGGGPPPPAGTPPHPKNLTTPTAVPRDHHYLIYVSLRFDDTLLMNWHLEINMTTTYLRNRLCHTEGPKQPFGRYFQGI